MAISIVHTEWSLPESIVHTEWSLPVVLKHQYTWLYKITSKLSQNTVNVLYKIYIGLVSVKFTLRSRTLYNSMLLYTNRDIGDQRRHVVRDLYTILFMITTVFLFYEMIIEKNIKIQSQL